MGKASHKDIRHHFVREFYNAVVIALEKTAFDENVAEEFAETEDNDPRGAVMTTLMHHLLNSYVVILCETSAYSKMRTICVRIGSSSMPAELV